MVIETSSYIDFIFGYLTLLNFAVVQMSHYQVGHEYTKKGKGERPVLTNSMYKVVTQ